MATASFMVDPAYQGRGVGSAPRARDRQRRLPPAMQFNAVVETNSAAVALWSSFGFEILTTVPEAFHHPKEGYVGLHVMHRRLNPLERLATDEDRRRPIDSRFRASPSSSTTPIGRSTGSGSGVPPASFTTTGTLSSTR